VKRVVTLQRASSRRGPEIIFAAGFVAVTACSGLGAVRLPLAVNLGRLVVAVGGGWIAFLATKQAWVVFGMLAAGSAAHGAAMIVFANSRLRLLPRIVDARVDFRSEASRMRGMGRLRAGYGFALLDPTPEVRRRSARR
jgi:hypothetical protein